MIWLIRSAMCDLMPAAGGLPGIADTDVDGFLAQVKRETTPLVWTGLMLGAVLYAWSPIVTIFVPLPSFLLPARLRDRHADAITATRIYLLRQSIFLLKMYSCMCWGQDSRVRARFQIAPYPVDPGTFRA